MRTRRGLTLIELMVIVGIIGLLMGLILPAIQKVRAMAEHVQCLNKVKQLNLATQSFAASTSGRLPSMIAGENAGLDSLYFSLLPYLDHGNYYAEVLSGARPRGSDYKMTPLRCPTDSTLQWNAGCSYACNGQVFKGQPRQSQAYRDGASHTIAYAEHYGTWVLSTHWTQFDWFYGMAPEESPARPPFPPVTVRRASFADAGSGDVVPITDPLTKTSRGSVPGLTFQIRPRPDQFDPRIAQTPHVAGMTVGMGDGSARKLGRISEEVYWALVTPRGGETINGEW